MEYLRYNHSHYVHRYFFCRTVTVIISSVLFKMQKIELLTVLIQFMTFSSWLSYRQKILSSKCDNSSCFPPGSQIHWFYFFICPQISSLPFQTPFHLENLDAYLFPQLTDPHPGERLLIHPWIPTSFRFLSFVLVNDCQAPKISPSLRLPFSFLTALLLLLYSHATAQQELFYYTPGSTILSGSSLPFIVSHCNIKPTGHTWPDTRFQCVKFYWNTVVLICLYCYGSFSAMMVQFICDRDPMSYKAKNTYWQFNDSFWQFTENFC